MTTAFLGVCAVSLLGLPVVPVAAHAHPTSTTITPSAGPGNSIVEASIGEDSLNQPTPVPSNSGQAQQKVSDEFEDPAVYFEVDRHGTIVDRLYADYSNDVVDDATGRTKVQWESSPEGVRLAWWSPAEGIEWTVQRKDHTIGTTTDTYFSDHDRDINTDVTYTITATHKDPGNNDDVQYFHYSVEIPAIDDSAVGMPVEDTQVLDSTHNSDLPLSAEAASASGLKTQIAYSTFIPNKTIPKPTLCTNGDFDSFGGDNRAFANKSNGSNLSKLPSRGLIVATLNWRKGQHTVGSVYKKVGETRAYKGGKVVERKTASTKGLTAKTTINRLGTKKYINIKQNISNPLCKLLGQIKAPEINADVDLHIDPVKSRISIRGRHDGAPNHEILLHDERARDIYHGCLYRFKGTNFENLALGMDVKVDVNMSLPSGRWSRNCKVIVK